MDFWKVPQPIHQYTLSSKWQLGSVWSSRTYFILSREESGERNKFATNVILKFSFYPLCPKTFNIVTILDILDGLLHEWPVFNKESKMSWTWKNKEVLIQLFSKNITRTNLTRITMPKVLPADPGVTWRTHGRLQGRREIFLTL